jgi:hypothetical protein
MGNARTAQGKTAREATVQPPRLGRFSSQMVRERSALLIPRELLVFQIVRHGRPLCISPATPLPVLPIAADWFRFIV